MSDAILVIDAGASSMKFAVFVHRIAREIGSLAAVLRGLEALVFTGGIGEHAAEVRERVCRAGAWLGVAIDESANQRHGPCINKPESAVSVLAIPADEARVIAAHTAALIAGGLREGGR